MHLTNCRLRAENMTIDSDGETDLLVHRQLIDYYDGDGEFCFEKVMTEALLLPQSYYLNVITGQFYDGRINAALVAD